MSSASVVSKKAPNLGQTFSAIGDWTKNPSLSNANAVLQTGDPSLQKTGDLLMGFGPKSPPEAQAAGAPPTLGASTMDALQNQLQQEVKMRASRTLFDNDFDSPETAGTQLLGN